MRDVGRAPPPDHRQRRNAGATDSVKEKPLSIDVTTTGAIPNGGQAVTMAVLAALERCKSEFDPPNAQHMPRLTLARFRVTLV